jgi:hypothetical protein
MSELPLVSCLCVTRGREQLVSRAIATFRAQTYPHKELVVLSESPLTPPNPDVLAAGVAFHRLENSGTHVAVGKQRNECLRRCRGEFVAVWDDDDVPHPERLMTQYRALTRSAVREAKACTLERELIYDEATGDAYLSGRRTWENAFFARRDALAAVGYAETQIGEDTAMVRAFRRRFGRRAILLLGDAHLYVYVKQATGTLSTEPHHLQRNTWRGILNASTRLSPERASEVRRTIADVCQRQPHQGEDIRRPHEPSD